MLRKYGDCLGARSALAAGVAGALALGSPARANTYLFDNYLYAMNDFSITSGGQTATFSSSSGPNTLTVNTSADIFTFPVGFGGFGNFNGYPLTITFSDPSVDQIVIPFGVFEAYATAPVTLVATSNTGQSAQTTTSFYNTVTGSPEGVIDFIPVGPINSLTLTGAMAFAIANVDLSASASMSAGSNMSAGATMSSGNTSAGTTGAGGNTGTSGDVSPSGAVEVQEPASAALLGGGLILMALTRRRRGSSAQRSNEECAAAASQGRARG